MDEPVNVPALTEFVEVIGTEVFIEGSALQHFIDGSEDRSGDGANGLFGAAAGAQAMELSLEVTGLFAGGGRGALDKGGFEPGCAPAFARAGFCASGWSAAYRHLVAAGAQAGPGDQVPGGWKAAHIAADFGKDDARTQLVDAGIVLSSSTVRRKGST